ncbi:S9 family peptidase [Microbacterium koreense]|uniref:S9 family peptidase n=1 Tax=Microbacterium koreense TaxID=323761 RepID=A0ABW2ZSK1_9MICO
MRADDLEALIAVGRPDIAPDASFAVFATSRPDFVANRNVGQIWRVDLPDGTPRRISRGVADAAPQLSPRADRLAFLRVDARGRRQVFVMDAAGSEPVQITDTALGVSEFAWSPDGARLAFIARVPDAGRYGTIDGLTAEAESPRHVSGVRWLANGVGYMADRPAHLFVVAAPDLGGEPLYDPAPALHAEGESPTPAATIPVEPEQLTHGKGSHAGVVFVGEAIATVVDDIEPSRRDLRSRVIAVPMNGGEPRVLLGRDSQLSVDGLFRIDDERLGIVGFEVGSAGQDFIAPDVAAWVLDASSGLSRATPQDGLDIGEPGTHVSHAPDGSLYAHDRTRGRVRLVRIDELGAVHEVFGGDVETTGHAVADGVVVVATATAQSFGELVVIGAAGVRTVTDFGGGAVATGIVRPRELTVEGRDGYPIHGWVAAPEGAGPHPVILQIHGGPYAAYGIHLFDETQVLVDAGYAVVYCNPRGSAGYGRDHGRSIRGAMGTVDFTDVIDFLDGAIASDSSLDGSRVGVMGGSYGGYLTAWTIAHDHRFAAAIVERGFLDPVSFQGTSDIGSFFGDEYVGVTPDAIARQSPMVVVDQVDTPTLVIHSELDFRCPLEQATRYYSALLRGGVEAEMLIFPGEDHELTRSGSPRHRRERFSAVLDWWSRHLPV